MINVLFITNVPSPYRIDFFNELGKKCNLTVVFQKEKSKERKDNWNNYNITTFKALFLNGMNINSDTTFSFKIKKIIKEHKGSKIVVCGFSSPTNILAISYMKKRKIPYFIEIDGGSPSLSNGKLSFKEKIKRKICSKATGYFSSGKSGDDYLLRYGATIDKIYRYSFTSLFEKDIANNKISEENRNKQKESYNIEEDKCVLTIGRFTYQNGFGKGFDLFVKVASYFSNRNIGFYIIGDEPTQYFINLKKDLKLNNLHFLPFYEKTKLFDLYKCSDLTMILSRGDVWGLVVNESLASGIPVISSDKCLAGKELIKNDYNGYIVNLNNLNDIIQKVEKVLTNNFDYFSNCVNSIKKFTIQNMVDEHLRVLGDENENMDKRR